MDTPAVPMPRDAGELAILQRLAEIRDQLLLLKQDRTTYIRSQDIIPLYDQTIAQVKELNAIRAETGATDENRVDKVLEGCFQLLSLFYLTIGRNEEAPATYALTSTIKRLLDHLMEANLYSAKDLESLQATLEQLSTNIIRSSRDDTPGPQHSPYLLELLSKRVERCSATLAKLQKRLSTLDDASLPTYEKMISILRSISYANTRSKFSPSEVQKLQKQLHEIGEKNNGGKFCIAGSESPGAATMQEVYDKCSRWSEIVLERHVSRFRDKRLISNSPCRKGDVPETFRETYRTLVGIRNELEKLSLTQAWSLRETDLYDFQRKLDKIDESRQNGNFFDHKERPADLWTQRTMLYLIRRSYAYIYSFILSSEPVSEALLPVYNQLQTLKRCLIEVKNNGGVSSVRELYPYSMKLASLDNMRVDGKFVVNGDIPEGQSSVSELLAECFDLNYDLRVAADEDVSSTAQCDTIS
ncbi:putative protein family UPF0662 [Cordyceps fumosorosea ARSEF 2679]|uniref:Uncharacterized protein n=1 Tax=Cordyceps fumosorosea (strain ARSEF 2679) TaxID=1081104 RepID=A0A167PNH0_CORFA|nr:putative protein family UPF0662 [Cordyceps fumosorosea ARSEF 2679]OAA56852.1 putative protein family UPF0662 [Cordyceps fumosorosea ARSEF 2679]